MSRYAYDFLTESLLFSDEHLATRFNSLRAGELQAELSAYRAHVLNDAPAVAKENTLLSVSFGSDPGSYPSPSRLKQCALYFDRAIVDDPLFAESKPTSPVSDAYSEIVGYSRSTINAAAIARAATLMKSLTPMVAGGFLEFHPLSYDTEPPEQLPIRYSRHAFEDGIPQSLLPLFWDSARVHSMFKTDKGWAYSVGSDPEPSRGIAVEFEGLEQTFAYHLFANRVLSTDDRTRTAYFEQWLPETPPDSATFGAWVRQSINQSAQAVLRQIELDLRRAAIAGSLVCTQSSLIAELLATTPGRNRSTSADLAELSLRVGLPVLESLSIRDLMRIRSTNGEAFANFRVALQRHVRELRAVEDRAELRIRLQNVAHELSECQVRDIDHEVKRIRKSVALDVVVAAGSLAAAFPSGGASLIGTAYAALKIGATAKRYASKVQAHPAYFLWRLQRSAR